MYVNASWFKEKNNRSSGRQLTSCNMGSSRFRQTDLETAPKSLPGKLSLNLDMDLLIWLPTYGTWEDEICSIVSLLGEINLSVVPAFCLLLRLSTSPISVSLTSAMYIQWSGIGDLNLSSTFLSLTSEAWLLVSKSALKSGDLRKSSDLMVELSTLALKAEG